MKVIVFQGTPDSQDIQREELVERWKTLLDQHNITYTITGGFDPDTFEDEIEDADALVGAWIKDNMFDTAFFKRHPKVKYIFLPLSRIRKQIIPVIPTLIANINNIYFF